MSFEVISPYYHGSMGGHWVKTQIHCHCREKRDKWNSFGGPKKLLEFYRDSFGYSAVAITDHHGKYLELSNPVLSDPNVDGVLFIRGLEDSSIPHMVALGCKGMTGVSSHLYSLEGRMREYTEQGGVLIAAHPLNKDIPWERENLNDGRLTAIEIKDESYSQLWTALLTLRLQTGIAPIYGVCVDDAHEPASVNQGWVMVQPPHEYSEAGLMHNIKTGAFVSVRCNAPQPADFPIPRFDFSYGAPGSIITFKVS